ncbi:MAG: 23S rRNA (adenine(2503)-C(2))-methyltransferase RlmN [Lachnospiraceae bacterium]|nr:23S rRNA (adenine(2503)-C(2))-methyltransferase RlmN [Lachnospiraceae bacterium]
MNDLRSYTISELKTILASYGEKPYRASQIFSWLHEKRVSGFEEMTDISKDLRQKLSGDYCIVHLKIAEVQSSKKDGTKKFLYELHDGNLIESVFMKYREWNSACISSQAGCDMGCRFCASGIDGCVRSLTAAEMLDEIYTMEEYTGEKINSVVVMGSGEPLLLLDELLRFIEIITADGGKHLSQRSITVSTCGIVPKIRELAEKKLQINLAISLHAATDEKRQQIMPIAKKYSIAELMDACVCYFEQTGRRLTFEYALIDGFNDTGEDAAELADLLKGKMSHVNLIPVNPVKERDFRRPDGEKARRFKVRLENFGINVTIRRELGSDIDGACGQLRRKRKKQGSEYA